MKRILILICFLLVYILPAIPQYSSQQAFQFLNLAMSPRVASLGGNFLPLDDDDLMLALHNPALIKAGMHNHIGLSFLDYHAGINAGNVVYGRHFERYGSFLGGVRFLHYGTFQRTDPTGLDQGSFTASDLAITVGWGRELHPGITMGANLNLIMASYDAWSSFALATDLAAHYKSSSGLFQASLLARNAGRQIDRFGKDREKLPFEIAGGVSQKLKHAPLRMYLLLSNLQTWDLTYEDPLNPSFTVDPISGEVNERSKLLSFLDKGMRHVTAGVEFMPGNLLRFRLGYDYRTRQELGVQSKMGMVGFSWGIGLKLGKYYFDFSRSRDHLAGAPNYFSIRTNLGKSGEPKVKKA